MAEELAAAEAEDGVIAPEEEAIEQEAPQLDPIEEFAKAELGWAPKEEFQGDEADWRPAAEFIKVGRDITRTVTKKLHSVEDQLSRLTRVAAENTADKLAERDAYWQRVQAKAVEEGDNETVNRAVDERVKLKAAAPADTGPPPETADFMERHKAWMGVDPLATVRAKEIADKLAREGVSIPDQLVQVERAIKKEFPELFPTPAKRPAATQTGAARSTDTGSRKKGFADMPAASQEMARDYLKRHGVPLEKTAASYWDDPSNQERKVG